MLTGEGVTGTRQLRVVGQRLPECLFHHEGKLVCSKGSQFNYDPEEGGFVCACSSSAPLGHMYIQYHEECGGVVFRERGSMGAHLRWCKGEEQPFVPWVIKPYKSTKRGAVASLTPAPKRRRGEKKEEQPQPSP